MKLIHKITRQFESIFSLISISSLNWVCFILKLYFYSILFCVRLIARTNNNYLFSRPVIFLPVEIAFIVLIFARSNVSRQIFANGFLCVFCLV